MAGKEKKRSRGRTGAKKVILTGRKSVKETSAGGVVYTKRNGRIKVVLVGRFKPFVTWRIPKGHQELGEKLIEAARREVSEESGLKVTGGPKLGCTNFYFVHPIDNKFIHKYVHYYLFKKKSGSVVDHDKEYDKAKWFTFGEAIKAATFKNDKLILKRASVIIRRRQKRGKVRSSKRGRSNNFLSKSSEVDLGVYQAGSAKD